MAEDLIYNVPLRREWLKVPRYRRTKKAVRALREFISKHTKVEDVRIGKYLNLRLWEHGRKNPPHKITVKVTKEKDFVRVELPDAPEEKVEEPKKKKGLFGKKEDVKEETKEEEVETESTEESEESSSKEDADKTAEIDYDAELEAERKRVPDPARAREAFKLREEKRKEKEEVEEEEEDKPLTRRDLDSILSRETDRIRKETNAERIEEIANNLSSSPSEARLIVEIHKNRAFPENLSLREQVEEAWAIANKKKLVAKNSELARALRSKDNVSRDTASTHDDGQKGGGSAPKMSALDKQSYERAGFKFNVTNKRWEKKLPSGKTLVKDPASKKSFVI